MVFNKVGGTTQQRAWFDAALDGLLYQWAHPALACTVLVRWVSQDALQALGDHGAGTYYAFTEVPPGAATATLSIWNGLDSQAGEFGSQAFYMETVAHEIGHIVAGMRSATNPSFQDDFTAMVSGTGSWSAGEWSTRLLESFAEIFKDVFLPGRRFNNRTTHQLRQGSFDAFLDLVNVAEESYTAPHIDYDVDQFLLYHGRGIGLYGNPFVINVGYPFHWGIGGEPGRPVGYPDGITGGIFAPQIDRGAEFSTQITGFDLTMTPDFGLPYATNDDVANPPPPDPEYNADADPANLEYVGWGNGWWNAEYGIGDDPSGYNPAAGRRIRNRLFWYTSDIESVFGGTIPGDPRGGPLFFLRWELVDPFTYLTEPDAIRAQALLDANYSHFEPLVGQVPQFSGTLTSPPNLRELGFTADCPVRLRIGTEAIAQITHLVGGVETEVNGGQVGDVRPAGPGVTEEWHDRLFTVTFAYHLSNPSWPYQEPAMAVAKSPVGTIRRGYRGP